MKLDNIKEIKGQLVTLKYHKVASLFTVTVKPTNVGEFEQELLLDDQQLLSLIDVIKSIEED